MNNGIFLLIATVSLALWYWSIRPLNTRRWARDQIVLPYPTIAGDQVFISNIRNFSYRTEEDYTPGYYDRLFNAKLLRQVFFVFVPFPRSRHAAHAFLTFEFKTGDTVAVSVEIRKRHTQKYSPLKGLLKQYELMYVIADESDVLGLRIHCRKNDVYRYPLRLSNKAQQQLFLHVVARAHKLINQPEFYNTVRNACVTNLVRHLNAVIPDPIPFNIRLILSGYADRYMHERGLIDTPLPFEQARQAFYVSSVPRLSSRS